MNLVDQVIALTKLWLALKSERAGEFPTLDQWSGRPDTHDYFSRVFKAWQEILKSLGNLPKRKRSSIGDCESAIVSSLAALNFLLANRANGIQWLLDKGMLQYLIVSEAQFQILKQRIGEERHAVAEAFQAELEVSAKKLLDGVEVAASIELVGARMGEILTSAGDSQDEMKRTLESTSKRIQKLSPLLDETENRVSVIEASATSASESVLSASASAEKISTLAGTAKSEFEASKSWLDQAADNLSEALRSVKQQGLAGAFANKAVAVNDQLVAEKQTFGRTMYYLAFVSLLALGLSIYRGYPETFEAWAVRIVQMAALAAPGVWIGWITARRMAALTQILSDYEYKAATALAFESYKKEVMASGDPVLMETLLAQAIKAFGENPTHYYDKTQNDPHHPAEGVLDGIRKRLSKPAEAPASAAVSRKVVAAPADAPDSDVKR